MNQTEYNKCEAKTIDVYLIGGQSNAAGATQHKCAFNGVFKNVLYAGQVNKSYTDGSTWSDNISSFESYNREVTIGLGERPDRMGPEYGMAEIFNDYYSGDKKTLIFKSAAGATSMVAPCDVSFGTWLPRSMWEKGYDPKETSSGIGYQYHTFTENFANVYKTLKENGYIPKIKGMAWMQGESDLSFSRLYGEALRVFISDIRSDLYEITGDLSVKTMPFVIGEIAKTFRIYNNPYVPEFIQIQREVANNTENCETVKTDDFILVDSDGSVKGSDPFHFSYNDSRALGNRFALKILEINQSI